MIIGKFRQVRLATDTVYLRHPYRWHRHRSLLQTIWTDGHGVRMELIF